MSTQSVSAVVDVLRRCRLLEAAQLEEVCRTLQSRSPNPQALAKELVQRGWLTPFQVNHILQGRAAELVVGPYVVLERLGEGAAGQVLKARHQGMNRTVALKVLRKDLLADKDAVGRFYREVETLSRLSHPNIVHAYDADVVGATHFLAMEFVEGVDLQHLVKEKGPLPISQACDYIRQAAGGLQHAYEKGLVHRDIKPSNLLVSKCQLKPGQTNGSTAEVSLFGLVKILDLGLARLQQPAAGSRTRNLTVLAGNSVMQGTPDYMAPEQALDFHSADIRADIYSLGCTFYFLLTGQAPFEGGTLPEKLLKHQSVAPKPIEEVRQGVPPGLSAILQKMLAKRPPDRYQTPGEAAADIRRLLITMRPSPANAVSIEPQATSSGVRKRGSTLRVGKELTPGSGVFLPETGSGVRSNPLVKLPPIAAQGPPKQRPRWQLWAGVGGGALLLVIVLLAIFGKSSPEGTEHTGAGHGGAVSLSTSSAKAPPVRTLPATLIVQCGKDGGKQQDERKQPGYDYKLLQGILHDGWPDGPRLRPHCWHDGKEVHFEITVPQGTSGILRLTIVDGDNLDRKEDIFVAGKQFGTTFEKFHPGELVEVPISHTDTAKGSFEVRIENKNPKVNAVVSTVEFLPISRNR